MNEAQKDRLKRAQEQWAKTGTVYGDIVEKDDVIYVLFGNGTAYAIYPNGRVDWVVGGWEDGKSIVERPCSDMVYVLEADDYYCKIDNNCCYGPGECRKKKFVCKNCGGDIFEQVRDGVGKWTHNIEFGDCVAEPIEFTGMGCLLCKTRMDDCGDHYLCLECETRVNK